MNIVNKRYKGRHPQINTGLSASAIITEKINSQAENIARAVLRVFIWSLTVIARKQVRKRFKARLVLVMALISFVAAFAVPAPQSWVTHQQPDGHKITVKVKGDERINWYESPEGYTLLLNNEKYWTYAIKDSTGSLIPSNYKYYSDVNPVVPLNKGLFYSAQQIATALKMWKDIGINSKYNNTLQQYNAQKIEGARKYLVILMSYPDKQFTRSREEFDTQLNEENHEGNGNAGSVRDFYVANSYGKFTPEFVVVGPYVAEHPMEYYEYNGVGATRASELIVEAVRLAAMQVDFSQFDNDNDGYVDAVNVIFAGYGAEAGYPGTIWSHASNITPNTQYDGKWVTRYCCSPELKWGNSISNIGVFSHEFCHTLGAPDYYDTDYGTGGEYDGAGKWCLMASGSWNGNGGCPSSINAFQKWLFGWIEPKVITATDKAILNMPPTANTPIAYRINTNFADEFFILENRQQVGFDSYLPGHGLIIWHTHPTLAENMSKPGNSLNAKHPQLLYPVCAASTTSMPTSSSASYGDINSAGCPFPGNSNNKFFNSFSVPAALAWDKSHIARAIANIREVDTFVSFDCNAFSVPYSFDFEDNNHFANFYQSIGSISQLIFWQRAQEASSSNWVAQLRSFPITEKTPFNHYLFLPPLYLNADETYNLKFNSKVYSKQYSGNIKIFLCETLDTNAQKTLLSETLDISNETYQRHSDTFNISKSGIYYIAICSYSQGDNMDLYVDDIDISKVVNSINEKENDIAINCYPNPSFDHIFISNSSADKIKQIDIIDILGKTCISLNSKETSTLDTEQHIDISTLKPGSYYIVVQTVEGNVKVKGFVKILH